MSTFTLIRTDVPTRCLIDFTIVEAPDRNAAIIQRPEGWPRRETTAHIGFVPYLTA